MTDEDATPSIGARRAVQTSAGVIAGRLTAHAASLAMLVITARQLGADGRGVLVLVVTLTSFSTIVSSLGLPVAARLHLVDPDLPIASTVYIGLTVALAAANGLLTPAIAMVFLPLTGVHLAISTLAWIGVYAVANTVLYLLVAALLAFGRLVQASFCDASGFVLQALGALGLAVVGSRSFLAFIVVLAIGSLVPAVLGAALLRRAGIALRPRRNPTEWQRLLKTGWPSLGTVLSESATFRVDRLILGVLATPAAVGVYSVAASGAEIIRFIPASVNQLVFYEVVMGRMHGRGLRRVRGATIGGLVGLGLLGAALAPFVVHLVVGDQYAGAVTPFRILLLAEVGFAFYFFDSTVLAGSHLVRLAARAAVIGMAAVLVADLSLIPFFDAAGAAWASVLAYWTMALAAAVLRRQAMAEVS